MLPFISLGFDESHPITKITILLILYHFLLSNTYIILWIDFKLYIYIVSRIDSRIVIELWIDFKLYIYIVWALWFENAERLWIDFKLYIYIVPTRSRLGGR